MASVSSSSSSSHVSAASTAAYQTYAPAHYRFPLEAPRPLEVQHVKSGAGGGAGQGQGQAQGVLVTLNGVRHSVAEPLVRVLLQQPETLWASSRMEYPSAPALQLHLTTRAGGAAPEALLARALQQLGGYWGGVHAQLQECLAK